MAVFWGFSTWRAVAEGFALFPAVVLSAFFAVGVIAFAAALTAAPLTALTMGKVAGLDFAKGMKTSSGHKRRAEQHSISSQQRWGWRLEKFKDQRGKTVKMKANTAAANGYLFFLASWLGEHLECSPCGKLAAS